MSKQKGSGVYKDDDCNVVVKIPKEVYKYLSVAARDNFRSLPMHISYILTSKMREIIQATSTKTETLSKESNKPLYTEEELEDIYKKSKEADDNVNRG